MSTAQELIDLAFGELGLYPVGSSPSTNDRNYGLTKLRNMLEFWSVKALTCYERYNSSLSLTGGNSSTTLTNATARIVSIDDLYELSGNTKRHYAPMTRAEYMALNDTATQSTITRYYAELDAANTWNLFFDHAASATTTIYYWVTQSLYPQSMALNTSLSLPEGYEHAIIPNLSIEIAPRYGAVASPYLIALASDSLESIRLRNSAWSLPKLESDLCVRSGYDIDAD
jgi:hypothetical protein